MTASHPPRPPAKSRLRRARIMVQWGSAVACALLVALWCFTLKYTAVWCNVPASARGGTKVAAYVGTLGLVHFEPQTGAALSPVGWEVYPHDEPMIWWPTMQWGGGTMLVMVPLWMPAAALGLLAAGCWWLGRGTPRPGHCRCGYSLAGLAEGAACPECGRKA